MNNAVARQMLFPQVFRVAAHASTQPASIQEACLYVLELSSPPEGVSEEMLQEAKKAAHAVIENFL